MAIWQNLLGTTEAIFGLGKSGPKFRDNASTIELRNNANNAFVNARALDYIIGNNGSILPIGAIVMWGAPITSIPSNFLPAIGGNASRATYSSLFSILGTAYGVGDLSTTFGIPDLRSRNPRGYDNGLNLDPDRATRTALVAGTWTLTNSSTTISNSTITVTSTTNLAPGMTCTGTGIPASSVVRAILGPTTFTLGNTANTANVNATATNASVTLTFSNSATANYLGSVQADQFTSHTHTTSGILGSTSFTSGSVFGFQNFAGGGPTINNTGGNETRGKNISVNFMIRAL